MDSIAESPRPRVRDPWRGSAAALQPLERATDLHARFVVLGSGRLLHAAWSGSLQLETERRVTELQILAAEQWDPEDLLRQVAVLCRVAPTWDRTLRWPSPLHLARAVVRDHPHGYANDGEEEEEVEDGKPLRLDLGM
jgi:hypothetical protein